MTTSPLRARAAELGGLLFTSRWWLGLLIAGLLALHPRLLLGGALALAGAWLLRRLLRSERPLLHDAINPLLVGLAAGAAAPGWGPLLVGAPLGGAVVQGLTYALARLFGARGLPLLSLPFVLTTTLAQLALGGAGFAVEPILSDAWIPSWLAAPGRALAAVLFLPEAWAGILLLLALALHSRIQLTLALLGWAAHVAALAVLGVPDALHRVDAFNGALVAICLGAGCLVPGRRTLGLALIAAAASGVVAEACVAASSWFGITTWALPFNLVALLALLAVPSDDPLRWPDADAPNPELAVIAHHAARARFAGSLRSLALPVAGEWTVYQGADGPWTHVGPWRHAIDLVISGPDGATHRGHGGDLHDYLCWQQPVLSPVDGTVVTAIDDRPDCPVGTAQQGANWGNAVVIADARGFHVVLAHLARGSVCVAPGQVIRRGQQLGRCGSSGYSPQPHLHVHVQTGPGLGDASLPFAFVTYEEDGAARTNALPAAGARVRALPPDLLLERRLTPLLDEARCFARGDALAIHRAALTPDGGVALRGAHGELSVGIHDGSWYAYRARGAEPLLRDLACALPRLPLTAAEDLRWSDALGADAVVGGWRLQLAGLLAWLAPRWATVRAELQREGGLVTCVLSGPVLARERRYRTLLDGGGVRRIDGPEGSWDRREPPPMAAAGSAVA